MEATIEKQVQTQSQVDPSKIMQIGMGFWASKTLLSAVSMGLFTHLSQGELSGQAIKEKLGLHQRGLYDFLDTLVALGFLNRAGLKETSVYSNAPDSDLFLDKNKPTYVGGMLEMCNSRLYAFWNNLDDGLKTGQPQNELKSGGKPLFEELYADEAKLREFLNAMGGIQMGNFMAFANKFDFSNYRTLCDIGGAGAFLSVQVAMNNSNMSCISFDLPPVGKVANENIIHMGVADKVTTRAGDFFKDDLPKADVITMGNILHDWGTDTKKMLIKKAYNALPDKGALVIIEAIIDNDRNKNAFGLMMSLNMLIETTEGYDFSGSDFNDLAIEVGFKETSIMPLTGPSSAAIAIK